MAFANGRDAFLGGGNLDHQVRAADTRPELFHLANGRFGVMRKVRADLDAHISIAAIGFFVQRAEQITGSANIFDGKLPEDLFRIPARPRQGHRAPNRNRSFSQWRC